MPARKQIALRRPQTKTQDSRRVVTSALTPEVSSRVNAVLAMCPGFNGRSKLEVVSSWVDAAARNELRKAGVPDPVAVAANA